RREVVLMELRTSSAVIAFAQKCETESAQFYEDAASRFSALAPTFRGFEKENAKNVQDIKRAYYSVISDALETGFSFKNLASESYEVETDLSPGAEPSQILRTAIENETRLEQFYLQAAKTSQALMADLSRVFKRLCAGREKRKSVLRQHLERVCGPQGS
ncbi:MAG: hypothetical protein ACP5IL_12295, partial [Syntrophobacteraceae bacterium]